MPAALTRYRVLAYVVGTWLLVLMFYAVPADITGNGKPASIVGTVHGYLYIVYVIMAFDLGRRCRWPLKRTVLVMLAGTIPFLSFFAERRVTRMVRAQQAAPTDSTPVAPSVPGAIGG